jgi:hypothetical protein
LIFHTVLLLLRIIPQPEDMLFMRVVLGFAACSRRSLIDGLVSEIACNYSFCGAKDSAGVLLFDHCLIGYAGVMGKPAACRQATGRCGRDMACIVSGELVLDIQCGRIYQGETKHENGTD